MHSRFTRLFSASLLVLFLLAAVVRADQYNSEIAKFMGYCLNENESFTKERIGSSNYYFVSIGKFETGLETTYTVQDSFVLHVSEDNSSNVTIANNTDEIVQAITNKYIALNITYDSLYPTQSELGQTLALVLQFNDSREPLEGKCRLWTGTDHNICIDRDSCLKATFATPMGNQVSSGVGWPFVDSVWEFTNETKSMNANVSGFISNLNSIENKTDDVGSVLGRMQGELQDVQSSVDVITQSPLFDPWRYSFCYPIPYNRTSLITAKVYVKRMNDRMEAIFSIPDQAKSAVEGGLKRAETCRRNSEASANETSVPTFWAGLTKDERNILRIFASEVSPSPELPIPVRSWEIGWE